VAPFLRIQAVSAAGAKRAERNRAQLETISRCRAACAVPRQSVSNSIFDGAKLVTDLNVSITGSEMVSDEPVVVACASHC
jgi:hypothetical protein